MKKKSIASIVFLLVSLVMCQVPAMAAVNKALQFNGTDQFVRTPQNHGLACPLNDFTFEVWVKVTTGGQIFGAYRDISVRAGANSIGCSIWPGGTSADLSVSTANNANQWVYIAFVRSGTTLIAYRNGVQVGSRSTAAGTFDLWSGWGGLHIGSNVKENEPDTISGSFGGAIDEMRISNAARSATEIQQNWNSGAGKLLRADGVTISLWHFDEGSGKDLHDVITWNDSFLGWYKPSDSKGCPAWVDGFPFPGPTGDISVYCPDMAVRLGAKILVVATGVNATDKFKASLTGPGINSIVYQQQGPLPLKFRFILNARTLSAGAYTLTCQLLDQNDNEIKQVVKTFNKPMTGIPKCGIDENNALVINHGAQKVFPIAPFQLYPNELASWAGNGYINCQIGAGFGSISFSNTLNTCSSAGVGMIGGAESWTPATVTSYVNASKNHSALWCWGLADEPDLNGVPPATVRSCTDAAHSADPNHPVWVNFMGHPYRTTAAGNGGFYANVALSYAYPRQVADIYSIDYYPVQVTADYGTTFAQEIIVLADNVCDHARDWNRDLIPIYSFVEVTQFDGNHPAITPPQIRTMTWVNIIHGIKGIEWFPWHYFSPPAANLTEMARLCDQIARLPALLTADLEGTVTKQELSGGRIDIMSKEYSGELYIFAVNMLGSTQSCTFTIDGTVTDSVAAVFDESRTLPISGGQFTDSFGAYEVHVYSMAGSSAQSVPPAPTNLLATAGYGRVSLSWYASSSATSYNVYRGVSSGGESTTPIATGVIETCYSDTALTNGITYYYKVEAVNSLGTSGYSAEAHATPIALRILGAGSSTGGDWVLSWASETNRWYALDFTTNLQDGFPLRERTNIVGLPPLNVVTVRTDRTRAFYRLRVE